MVTDGHEPGGFHDRLTRLTGRVWALHELLEAEIHQPVGRGLEPSLGSTGGSKPPWHGQVADLLLDLHAEIRGLEADLFLEVVPDGWPTRGSSSENTRIALRQLPLLAVTVGIGTVRHVVRRLDGWVGRVEVFLGEREPVQRLPREPGEREWSCPWCGYLTLRYQVKRGVVFCVNPECRDDEDNRVTATVTPASDGRSTLTWQNGGIYDPSRGGSNDENQ